MRVVMKNRFELVHVGINTESPEKALQLAELLSAMFHLQLRHGKKSEFAGDYFECMKAPFLGSKGHIAMQTDDLAAAVEERKGLFLSDGHRRLYGGGQAEEYLSGWRVWRFRHSYSAEVTA